MKIQSAKAKGRRLQNMIVQDLLDLYPHLGIDDIKSTSMGANGEDVQMSSLARQSIPFSFEAKNQERVSIWACIEQARTNTPQGMTPAVVFKKNNNEAFVALPWKIFLNLLKNPDQSGSKKEEILKLITELSQSVSQL